MEGVNTEELLRIQQRIDELAAIGLLKSRYYLLSELGIALGPDLQVLKHASGKRLVEFIRERLSDHYNIVRSGTRNSIYAIERATERSDGRSTGTDGGWSDDNDPPSSRPLRYNHRFWAAFSIPIRTAVRLLDLETLIYTDVERPDPVPQGRIIIERDFIVDEGVEHRDEAITANIVRWLQVHDLPPTRFLDRAQRALRRHTAEDAPRSISVLEHILECLNNAQLERMTLTLDVVKALLGKVV